MTSSQESRTWTHSNPSTAGKSRPSRRGKFQISHDLNTGLLRVRSQTSPFSVSEENIQMNPKIYNQHPLHYRLLSHLPVYRHMASSHMIATITPMKHSSVLKGSMVKLLLHYTRHRGQDVEC